MKRIKTILALSIVTTLILSIGVYAGYQGYQYYQAEKKQETKFEAMEVEGTKSNDEVIQPEETIVNVEHKEVVGEEAAIEEVVNEEDVYQGIVASENTSHHLVTFIVQNGATGVYVTQTTTIQVPDGEGIPANAIPAVPAARRGWQFLGWTSHPAQHGAVTEDVTFIAQFSELRHYFTFNIGEGGLHEGTVSFYVRDGHFVFGARPVYFDIPALTTPMSGWEFVGWTPDTPVFGELVNRDVTEGMTFTAVFRPICECQEPCEYCNECLCECPELCDDCGKYPCECPEPCDDCGKYPCECPELCDDCGKYPCQCPGLCDDCGKYPCQCPGLCDDCGKYPYDCPELCDDCGKYPCQCPELCDDCGKYPCECVELCNDCNKYPCECVESNENNGNTENQLEVYEEHGTNNKDNDGDNGNATNVIVNTSNNPGNTSPQTGDDSNIFWPVLLSIVSVIGLGVMSIVRRLQSKSMV